MNTKRAVLALILIIGCFSPLADARWHGGWGGGWHGGWGWGGPGLGIGWGWGRPYYGYGGWYGGGYYPPRTRTIIIRDRRPSRVIYHTQQTPATKRPTNSVVQTSIARPPERRTSGTQQRSTATAENIEAYNAPVLSRGSTAQEENEAAEKNLQAYQNRYDNDMDTVATHSLAEQYPDLEDDDAQKDGKAF